MQGVVGIFLPEERIVTVLLTNILLLISDCGMG
jgi:hypothetical protein